MRSSFILAIIVMALIVSCSKKNDLPGTGNNPKTEDGPLYKKRVWSIAQRNETVNLDTTYSLPDEEFNVQYVDEFRVRIPHFATVDSDTLEINAQASNDDIRVFMHEGQLVDKYLAYYPAKDSICITEQYVTSFGPQQNIEYKYIYANTK